MKLQPAQSVHICRSFQKMQEPEDFLRLLNDVKGFKYGEKAKAFSLGQIYYYVLPERISEDNSLLSVLREKRKYHRFEIIKKSGKPRTIHAPVKGLKMIQTCLNIILQEIYQPHSAAMGFVPGRSIVDNARVHMGQTFVYNLDLKDFFPSIDQARVWARLQIPPFNLTKGTSRQKIANMIAGLCCHNIDATSRLEDGTAQYVISDKRKGTKTCNVLPQGAPTSPTLTNIICERLDRKLTGLAKRFNLRYSRYADDITFSSDVFVYGKGGEFLKELNRIIKDQNFQINASKTRLQTRGFRQEVTGLVVNEQPNATKRYTKQVRKWLYWWETYGVEKAQAYFLNDYFNAEKGRARYVEPQLGNVLSGKLLYLKMVRGDRNTAYLKLQARLDMLFQQGEILPLLNERKINTKEKIRQAVVALAELEEIEEKIRVKKTPKTSSIEAALEIIVLRRENGLAEAMELYRNRAIDET